MKSTANYARTKEDSKGRRFQNPMETHKESIIKSVRVQV